MLTCWKEFILNLVIQIIILRLSYSSLTLKYGGCSWTRIIKTNTSLPIFKEISPIYYICYLYKWHFIPVWMHVIRICTRFYCVKAGNGTKSMVRILNVAEKNDAAKSIANVLSRGSSRMVTFLSHVLSWKRMKTIKSNLL